MQIQKFFNAFSRREKPDASRRRMYGFGSSSSGTRISEDNAMESSPFYRGVTYLSGQLSKLPWEVKERNNEIVDNDISYLLNVTNNGETPTIKLRTYLVQCCIIAGNGYAEIERDMTGRVLAIWPLNPNRVRPVRNEDGVLLYEISNGGYYGETVYLRPKDILHFTNIHMLDSISGQSTVSYAAQTLGISLGGDRFANNLFTNGGMPSGVIQLKSKINADAYARLKDTWKTDNGGRKTGGTAILEDGAEYKPLTFQPDVMQFLESRKFSVTEVARFLGIPPQKLFDTASSKYSNMEQAQLEVATDTIDTWCRMMEGEADLKLLSGRKGGRRTEFDISALVRGDSAARATYFQKMQQSGSISQNEIRKAEGRAGLGPSGDRFFIATNNLTPTDRIDEVIDSQISNKIPPAPVGNTPDAGQGDLTKAAIEFLTTPRN